MPPEAVEPIPLVPMAEELRVSGGLYLAGGVVLMAAGLAIAGRSFWVLTLLAVGLVAGVLIGVTSWRPVRVALAEPGLPSQAVLRPSSAARGVARRRTVPLLVAVAGVSVLSTIQDLLGRDRHRKRARDPGRGTVACGVGAAHRPHRLARSALELRGPGGLRRRR